MDLSLLVQKCTPANVSRQTRAGILRVQSTHRPPEIAHTSIRRTEREEFILNAQPVTTEQTVGWALWPTTTGCEFFCRLSHRIRLEGRCDCSAAGRLTDAQRTGFAIDLVLRKR
jgi:hypothetical protein